MTVMISIDRLTSMRRKTMCGFAAAAAAAAVASGEAAAALSSAKKGSTSMLAPGVERAIDRDGASAARRSQPARPATHVRTSTKPAARPPGIPGRLAVCSVRCCVC